MNRIRHSIYNILLVDLDLRAKWFHPDPEPNAATGFAVWRHII